MLDDFEIALIQVKVFVASNQYRPDRTTVTTETNRKGSGNLRLLGTQQVRGPLEVAPC